MIPGLAAYFASMIFVVKPWLLRLQNRHWQWGTGQGRLTVALLLLLGSALATEWLGIHALFGAFFAGFVMPKDEDLVRDLTGKVEPLAAGLFLPIFFALTGLRTSITLLSGPEMWFYFTMILVIAVAGKLFGSLISARLTGMSWREAGAIGVLMNTRGLIELVILNIGFEVGLIPATLFSMMVLMALVTTFMTSPLLSVIYPPRLFKQHAAPSASPTPTL
jgi:Kef-type K+ transport system membrane component KefB